MDSTTGLRIRTFRAMMHRPAHVRDVKEKTLAAGFDEGLLADETGRISEGTITNVGLWRDGTVIWPDAPKLDGITMLVLRRQLAAAGVGQAEETVRVQDLPRYGGMILCNSRGWAPVGRVDDQVISQDETFTAVIKAALASCPGCGRISCRCGWNGRSVPINASADIAAVMSATRKQSSASLWPA